MIVGCGGREHALAWALAHSPQVEQLYAAPGNGGTAWPANPNATGLEPRAACENINLTAIADLLQFAQDQQIDLTVVGPEVPLVEGIVDVFTESGLAIFGPSQAAAQLEGSKAFAKNFMQANHIPTAEYGIFNNYDVALKFVRNFGRPVVVKADGLAAGKGVLVCNTVAEAEHALHQIMQQQAFGTAGQQVVIEERLMGREISVLAFADGRTVVQMPVARDHKRALDGDQGLNTGGMGAFTPTPDVTPEQLEKIQKTVLQPVIDGMLERGTPYRGVLFAGLMLTDDGIHVLEYNCRLGDPETQVILPLLENDLYDVLLACIKGTLTEIDLQWNASACATIILASPGYPEAYPKGLPIKGAESAAKNTIIFHAGTKLDGDKLVTNGGRVMAVTALGDDLATTLQQAYTQVEQIKFEDMHYRRDIGKEYQHA